MKTILRQTPGSVGSNGLMYFRMGLWVGPEEVDHWAVNSGQPGVQNLRTYEDKKSLPGNYEPIPEAVYKIKPKLAWAGGPDDWNTYWNDGLGPVLVDLVAPKEGQKGFRSLFRIHLDANRSYAPGSAGCPVHPTLGQAQEFIAAFLKYAPTEYVVDHGLGTVPGPPGKPNGETKTEPKDWKVYVGHKTGSALVDTVMVDANGRATMTAQVLAALTGHKLVVNNKARAIRFEPQ